MCFSAFGQSDDISQETFNYQYGLLSNQIHSIDSGITNLEAYNFLQPDGWEYVGLGNTGLAHNYLSLLPAEKKGFQSGMRYFDQYKYDIDNIKYYFVNKPFSEIRYTIGSNGENVFGASHTQRVKGRFTYGLDFNRIRSEGTYVSQRTRDASFSLYGMFNSKNNRYHLNFDLVYDKIKAEENGGLEEDILSDSATSVFNPLLLATNLDEGLTEHKNFEIKVSNFYDFGFSTIDSINDSLSVKRFNPIWRISHSIGTSKHTYGYVDFNPELDYYNNFYQNSDSIYYRLSYHEIPHQVAVHYTGAFKKGDKVAHRNMQGKAYIQHDNLEVWQNRKEESINNLHLGMEIMNNAMNASSWKYSLSSHYYLTGYNKGDLGLQGAVGYDFDKFGVVSTYAGYSAQAPSFIEHQYFSSSFSYENEFDKKRRLSLGLNYALPKYNLKIEGSFTNLQNFIYFATEDLAVQYDEALQHWQVNAFKGLKYKVWHWDNFIGMQGVSNSEVIRLPKLFWKSSFYVQGKIFKGNMLGMVGFDVRYNTNYAADAWNPLLGQFYNQNERVMKYVPMVDLFINFKVAGLRVFIKSNYISQGLFAKNVYTALNYADRGRTFTGGLSWRFFE